MVDLRCTLKIHVGGKFVEGLDCEYLNGVIAESKVDPDLLSFYVLMEIIKDCGYGIEDNISVFHKLPNSDLKTGLVPLYNQDDLLNMFAMHSGRDLIEIYVDCPNEGDEEEGDNEEGQEEVVGIEKSGVDQGCITDVGADLEVVGGGHGEGDRDVGVEQIEQEGVDAEAVGEMDEDSESDYEWDPYYDTSSSNASFSGVEESSDDEQEEGIAMVGLGFNFGVDNKGDEVMNSGTDSDDNNLVEEEEDENGNPIYAEFKESDLKNPKLIEGMKFPNVRVFRQLLREYHIKEGYTFTFIKNESSRVTVKCAVGCGFRLHASPMYEERSFQIKKIKQQHECTRKYSNNNATSTWLSQKYLAKISDAPEIKVKSMKKTVRRECLLNVSQNQVYRAKRKALELIQGNFKEQYLRLWDYCEMIRIQNPGSMAILKVERPLTADGPLFQRMFVSFDAQVKGFLEGCRPIIGLDACFLKGPYGGQMMHAVAKDGNNQMFPLAMAVVEAETKDSWAWFMENLEELIGNPEERRWCFISDRQKGLTQVFADYYPNVEHRYCIRHMYANFNKIYKGKEWKDLMWGAASAYTVQEFDHKMNEINEIDEEAYNWLMREEPITWARSMYSTRSKCSRMDNNTSEAFNQAIREARDKPMLTMLESVRRYLMTRLQTRFKLGMGFKGITCPRIRSKIESRKKFVGECEVMYSGGTIFEVMTILRTYIVDIGQRTCTCRTWDVSGIPCVHGLAAIMTDKSDPEGFVDKYYHCSSFLKTYNQVIKPIPDQTMWVHTDFDPISPPPIRKRAGRPKKNRRKGEDEPKTHTGVRKHYTTLRCGKCKQSGHNARTCSVIVARTSTAQVSGVTRGRSSQTVGGRGRGSQSVGGRGRGQRATRARGGRRGRGGRGRGGREGEGGGANLGVIIGRDQGPNTNDLGARGRGSTNGRGKEPIGKGKQPMGENSGRGGNGQPMSRFGGRGLFAPRVGLPIPQGFMRPTRIGNGIFMTESPRSSAASCASGSASGSATMAGTITPYSQGATSTPSSTKKSTT